jgi:hypothetical protein
MTWQDAAYEEGMEALYAEFKPQAIEEFTEERLQSYYVANPNLAEDPVHFLSMARQLISHSPTGSFIFAAIAVEVGLKVVLLKPVVYGLVHSESIAEMIADLVVGSARFDNKFRNLLFGILSEVGSIDLAKYKRPESLRTLWEEIKEIQERRNKIMHRAEIVVEEESHKALSVATTILEELFPLLIKRLGLHLHEGGRVCNDQHCNGKEILEKLRLESESTNKV